MEKMKSMICCPPKVPHGVSIAVLDEVNSSCKHKASALGANMLVVRNNFWYIYIYIKIMIPPIAKNSSTVTGGHRGGREVKWCHAANCKWQPLRALNLSSWTKPFDFAGKKVTFMPWNNERPGISAGLRDTGGVKWKTSYCCENREPPMLQRNCLPARTLIPPSCASIISKWDFSLIGAWAKMFN